MSRINQVFIVLLLSLTVVLLVIDIRLRLEIDVHGQCNSPRLFVPVEFVRQYPDCTNRLIEAANLTNVHVTGLGVRNINSNRSVLLD